MPDEDGTWNEVSFTQDGSYLVFDFAQTEATIALVQTVQSDPAVYLAAAGVLLASVAVLYVRKRKKTLAEKETAEHETR